MIFMLEIDDQNQNAPIHLALFADVNSSIDNDHCNRLLQNIAFLV